MTLRYRMLDAASLAAWPEPSLPSIAVYGAGHVGRALVAVLATLDVRIRWIDERAAGFPADVPAANVERVCVDPVEDEVDDAAAGAIHLVVTHRHDLDLRIVEAILRRGDFAFLGLIGSATKRRRFAQLLGERGIDDATLARMTCPIGIDGIDGKEPAHIAIAVAAQVLPIVETHSRTPAEARGSRPGDMAAGRTTRRPSPVDRPGPPGLRIQLGAIEHQLDAVVRVVADRLVEAQPLDLGPRGIDRALTQDRHRRFAR